MARQPVVRSRADGRFGPRADIPVFAVASTKSAMAFSTSRSWPAAGSRDIHRHGLQACC